jgi:putative flavoprotein involved in K+ transport
MAPRALERPDLLRVGRALSAQDGLPLLEGDGVARDIRAIVWCTGFRPDFGWIELPVLGMGGQPLHRRGIATGIPGLAFVGMRFQYRMGSALLGGVGEDAAYVVGEITAYVRGMREGMDVVDNAPTHKGHFDFSNSSRLRARLAGSPLE